MKWLVVENIVVLLITAFLTWQVSPWCLLILLFLNTRYSK